MFALYVLAICLLLQAQCVQGNDYLISKWKLWYKSLDNRDGILSRADAGAIITELTEQLNNPTLEEVLAHSWYFAYILGDEEEVTEQQFIDTLVTKYKNNKTAFAQKMFECFSAVFVPADKNKDGYLSEDEYDIPNFAFPKSDDDMFFQYYKSEKGLMSTKILAQSWVVFTTETDSTNPDIVKTSLEMRFL